MKLLIPNAKELNTNQDAFSYQELSQKPQTILDILTDFSVKDLTNFYKINSSKADQEWRAQVYQGEYREDTCGLRPRKSAWS